MAPVQRLTRAQALQPQARGARVRWWGGVDRVVASDGRDCFMLRWGDSIAESEALFKEAGIVVLSMEL